MSKIVAIGTAVPSFTHKQEDILSFMQRVYALNEGDKRKLRFLYKQAGIHTRYSIISDYSRPTEEWSFYPPTENIEPFPGLEQRMQWYKQHAAPLSEKAIRNCLGNRSLDAVTHLITVSCTGMSAPGLDLELIELLDLPLTTQRYSINFMGCYAAIHAMKMADAFCTADSKAHVLIVCTELCTLHFQKESSIDSMTSSMLFADGSAAMLVGQDNEKGLHIDHFHNAVSFKGKQDMAWELSSKGFLMTLSGYVPELIREDFEGCVSHALETAGISKNEIAHWCIHPGGRKILEAVHTSLGFSNGQLASSYSVLENYGNMSSPTVLFVLKEIMDKLETGKSDKIFGAAFGPGITVETFILSS